MSGSAPPRLDSDDNPLRRESSEGPESPRHADEEELDVVNPATVEELPPLTLRQLVHGVVAGFPIDREPEERGWLIASMVVTNFIFFVIGVSVIAFGVETLPQYRDGGVAFDAIEGTCVAIFTIEFIVRLVTTSSQVGFWSSPLTWIDLLSVLPYYVVLMIGGSGGAQFAAFRVLRLIRVTRIFKLVKNNIGFEAVFESMVSSKEALSLMGFMLVVAVATFSAAIYFAELQDNSFDEDRTQWVRPNGEVNPFQSMFHAFWWCVVTITTVGYGDDVPITGLGKAIAAIAAICGVFVISFPTAILGANFAEIHARKLSERREKLRRARKLRGSEGSPQEVNPPLIVGDGIGQSVSTVSTSVVKTGAVLSPNAGPAAPPRKVVAYVPDDDVPPREIIVSGSHAAYSPALVLQTQENDRWSLVVRREETFPAPGRNLVLNLILACQPIHDLVCTTLQLHGVDPSRLSVAPRQVEQLKVSATLPESLQESGIRLQTTDFMKPAGHVPIVFFCPDEDAEHQLVSELHGVSLNFDVSYELGEPLLLPLNNYRTATMVRSKNAVSMANLKGTSFLAPDVRPGLAALPAADRSRASTPGSVSHSAEAV